MLRGWFVQAVCDMQKDGHDLVLATVLSKSGSAPCLAGAKMLVRCRRLDGGHGGWRRARGQRAEAGCPVFETQLAEVMEFAFRAPTPPACR